MSDEITAKAKRIGFISTRVAGTDGVSLEISKWTDVLTEMGHECYFITGESDRPAERTRLIPEAHFVHPEIDEINRACLDSEFRSAETTDKIHSLARRIRAELRQAIDSLSVDVLIAENCLTIPLNVPLGIALVEVLMETGIPCIAHHHDFVWERERFLVNAVTDYLRFAFPPALPHIEHVVINTRAAREFSRHTGLSCRVIPNVMNFHEAAPSVDEFNRDFRELLGIEPNDLLILQPTRVVQRKGIEHSIELIHRLKIRRSTLVISHASGDEGDEYEARVRWFADMMGVNVVFADDRIGATRSVDDDGAKRFTVWDAYPHADLVTYPSTYEGFGNAFLEAVYFRKPILCNRYAIYRTDIEPCGFNVILMDGFLTDRCVEEVRSVLADEAHRDRMVQHNYQVAKTYFSYERLRAELNAILAKPTLTPTCSVGAAV